MTIPLINSTILTDILGSFVHAFSLRFSTVHAYANNLLRIFILIELIFFGIYLAIEGGDAIASLFKKILVIGAFQFLVSSYVTLVDALRDSFVGIGLAGQMGAGTLSLSQFLDPSALISHGLTVVYPIFEKQSLMGIIFGGGAFKGLTLLAAIFILLAFVWMGMQIFLISIEFYIITTLAVVMIPFGLFKPTAFLADRAFGSIFAVCIKLMVLAFVASVSLPVVQGLAFSTDNPTLNESLTLLIGVGAIALIMAKAPLIAVGMISGSAGLDVSNGIVQPVLSAASAAVGAVGAVSGATALLSKLFSSSSGGTPAGQGAAAKAASIPSDVPKEGG